MCDTMRDDDENMEQNSVDGRTIRFRGTGGKSKAHHRRPSPHGGRVENVDAVRYKTRSSANQDSTRKQRTYVRGDTLEDVGDVSARESQRVRERSRYALRPVLFFRSSFPFPFPFPFTLLSFFFFSFLFPFFFSGISLMQFLRTELTRGYQLEHDEERFSARREKVYSFIKIPREVERFMSYGFLQVRASFGFVRRLW